MVSFPHDESPSTSFHLTTVTVNDNSYVQLYMGCTGNMWIAFPHKWSLRKTVPQTKTCLLARCEKSQLKNFDFPSEFNWKSAHFRTIVQNKIHFNIINNDIPFLPLRAIRKKEKTKGPPAQEYLVYITGYQQTILGKWKACQFILQKVQHFLSTYL